jgi:hypothetical protein
MSGNWEKDFAPIQQRPSQVRDLLDWLASRSGWGAIVSIEERLMSIADLSGLQDVRTTQGRAILLVRELGWSREEALETRLMLRTFEEDWSAPGMEAYDEL